MDITFIVIPLLSICFKSSCVNIIRKEFGKCYSMHKCTIFFINGKIKMKVF